MVPSSLARHLYPRWSLFFISQVARNWGIFTNWSKCCAHVAGPTHWRVTRMGYSEFVRLLSTTGKLECVAHYKSPYSSFEKYILYWPISQPYSGLAQFIAGKARRRFKWAKTEITLRTCYSRPFAVVCMEQVVEWSLPCPTAGWSPKQSTKRNSLEQSGDYSCCCVVDVACIDSTVVFGTYSCEHVGLWRTEDKNIHLYCPCNSI